MWVSLRKSKIYRGVRVARWLNIEPAPLRKLTQLAVSPRLDDLRVPPGNRLELLRGVRDGRAVSVLMISDARARGFANNNLNIAAELIHALEHFGFANASKLTT